MSKIIIALDFATEKAALELVDQLDPALCRLKVGLEMYTAFGRSFVQNLMSKGFEIFLDLKFHDIPNTVAAACRQAADIGVWMTNVHALGGLKMMQAAKKAVDEVQSGTQLIAVTILTSHHQSDLPLIGVNDSVDTQVARLAKLTNEAGLDGIVCSAQEVAMLKSQHNLGDKFVYVTPGIRPEWAATGDQQRIMTPAKALTAGSSYLVIGRPITDVANPMEALQKIQSEIATLASQII